MHSFFLWYPLPQEFIGSIADVAISLGIMALAIAVLWKWSDRRERDMMARIDARDAEIKRLNEELIRVVQKQADELKVIAADQLQTLNAVESAIDIVKLNQPRQ